MDGLINVYKPYSYTPLQVVERFRELLNLPSNYKIGYAGRLDPLANGVLLLMLGERCKDRDQLQKLSKRYRFKLLLGYSTDTLDPMGLITKRDLLIDEYDLEEISDVFIGAQDQRIPWYSSYRIGGVPMFKIAKDKMIKNQERPLRRVEIEKIEILERYSVSIKELSSRFIDLISNVDGSFRQDKIIEQWKNESLSDNYLPVIQVDVKVSSGTYIRSLAEDIAEYLNTVGLAYDIERIEAGNFLVESSLRIIDEKNKSDRYE